MPRRAARVDANHGEIMRALERVGFTVVDFSAVGRGIPDLWAAKAGRQLWIEVKDGDKSASRRQLTEAQVKFRAKLEAAGIPVVVITSVEEAVQL